MATTNGKLSSSLSHLLAEPADPTASASIEVTLRCSDKLDEFEARVFTLQPGASMQIGRASKSTAKTELMLSRDNAFIDSPTISREHAVLSAMNTATSSPAPCVYLTDNGSMHGTMVNGEKLEAHMPRRLNNGDVLMFGANITREHSTFHPSHGLSAEADASSDSYTARKFTFEFSVPTRSYSRGFTVPDDVESSDDEQEDIEVDEAISCPPHYGSKSNPLFIEDIEDTEDLSLALRELKNVPSAIDKIDADELDEELEAEAEAEAEAEIETALLLANSSDASEVTEDLSSPAHEEQVFYTEDVSVALPAPSRYALVDEASSDDGIRSSFSSEEDGEVSHMGSCASIFDSDESQSEGDMELEDNMSYYDDEDEDVQDEGENPDSIPTKSADVIASEESQIKIPEPTASLRTSLPPTSTTAFITSPQKDEAPTLITPSPQSASKAEPPKLPEPDVPYFDWNVPVDESFNRVCFGNIDSAVPPRPTAPRPMQWGVFEYNSPFSPRESQDTSLFDDMSYSNILLASNMYHSVPQPIPEYSPDVLGRCSTAVEPVLPSPYAVQQPQPSSDNTWDSFKSPAPGAAYIMQTPPPAPSSEVSSPAPPARRTKVSIPEIVEDTTQKPPTPTSVTGGLKRKAEVLDEVVEEFEHQPSSTPLPVTEAASTPTQDTPAAEAAGISDTVIDQRPKKRLRSRIGGAVKSAAAWMVPGVVGAAGAVAFLTSVPNDFFVA
ncbi:hypothetical protein N0V90_004364 [Kalmusia sp. IMI 367209]|nr:hypothetical protein N0V90_004364 [Kalmusia sp. IMI 367209]